MRGSILRILRTAAALAPTCSLLILRFAGIDYLTRVFDPQQMDLYRVVTRDANDFPELGRRNRSETVERRNPLVVEYLNHWRRSEGWKIRDRCRAAEAFAALLRSPLLGLQLTSM